jgi:hypothetical protein
MPIKSFRGRIADEANDTISLHTNNGAIGYRIKRFQVLPDDPTDGTQTTAVVKIYTIPQSAVTDTVDFSDQTLLGCAFYSASTDTTPGDVVVIFDGMTFNQDIYLTNSINGTAGREMNYYIELEQVRLDLNENTVATLKDIRNITTA